MRRFMAPVRSTLAEVLPKAEALVLPVSCRSARKQSSVVVKSSGYRMVVTKPVTGSLFSPIGKDSEKAERQSWVTSRTESGSGWFIETRNCRLLTRKRSP